MSWSVLQSTPAAGSGGGSTATTTFTTAELSSGSTLIAVVSTDGGGAGNITSIKDAADNAFVRIAEAAQGGSNGAVSVYAMNTPAGDVGAKPAITVTFGSDVHCNVIVQEVSGLAAGTTAAQLTDGAAGTAGASIGSGQSVGPPSYASSATGEYLLYVYGDDGWGVTATFPAGYSQDPNSVNSNGGANNCIAYKDSTGTTESGQWTIGGSDDYGLVMVAFKLATSAPPPPAIIQQAGHSGGTFSSPQTFTFDTTSTVGNTLVAMGLVYDSYQNTYNLASITDDGGNTWHYAASPSPDPPMQLASGGAGSALTFVAWCINAAPATNVTISLSNTGDMWWRTSILELSGVAAVDAATGATGTNTSPSASIDLSSVNDLVIGTVEPLIANATLPPDWNQLTSSGYVNGYYYPGATGTYTADWSLDATDTWSLAMASFSPTIPLGINETTLPIAVLDQTYSTTLSAAGGASPYSWSIQSGALPSWASLDASTGVISGMAPASPQTATFTVGLTDADDKTAVQELVLTAADTYSIFGGSLPAGVARSLLAGVATDIGIQFNITGAGNVLYGYSWYIPVGADTNGANYSFQLFSTTDGTSGSSVTGSAVTGTGTWAIDAWNFTPLTTPLRLDDGATYVAVCTMPDTYAESGQYFWSSGAGSDGITSGPITAPGAGAALGGNQQPFNQPSTGGFPSSVYEAQFYGIDVTVGNGSLSISTTSLPDAVIESQYLATLSAGGGTAPYSWSVSSGALPGWATLDSSTGSITGVVPQTTGSSSFTVEATDSYGNTATQALTLTVSPPQPVGAPSGGPWTLAWHDEFDFPVQGPVTQVPNPAAWADYNLWGDSCRATQGSGGGTSDYSWSPHNKAGLSVSDSVLSIIARYESPYTPTSVGYDPLCPDPTDAGNAATFTSGIASTAPGLAFTYGYAEARMRIPVSVSGVWPAFYAVSRTGMWGPEMDIMEFMEGGSSSTVWAPWENPSELYHQASPFQPGSTDDDWHVWGMRWSPTDVTFFLDGTQYGTYTGADITDWPSFIYLTLQVMDNGGSGYPCSLDTDYLRIWTTEGVPDPPTVTSLSPASGVPMESTLTVDFSAVSGATSYRATCFPVDWQGYVDSNGGATPNTPDPVTGSSSPLTIPGLTNGIQYMVSVSAINGSGYSIESPLIPGYQQPGHGTSMAGFP